MTEELQKEFIRFVQLVIEESQKAEKDSSHEKKLFLLECTANALLKHLAEDSDKKEVVLDATLNQIVGSIETATKIATITRMLESKDTCQIPILDLKVGRKYGIEPEDIMSTFLALILLNHSKEDVVL